MPRKLRDDEDIPVLVVSPEGLVIVFVPRMSKAVFELFKLSLDLYERAIVVPFSEDEPCNPPCGCATPARQKED